MCLFPAKVRMAIVVESADLSGAGYAARRSRVDVHYHKCIDSSIEAFSHLIEGNHMETRYMLPPMSGIMLEGTSELSRQPKLRPPARIAVRVLWFVTQLMK
jgi:hypothetical protein